MSFKSPLFSQDFSHQITMCTAGLSIGPVVRTHHSLHLTFFDTGLELWKISLPELLHGDPGVKKVAFILRSGMYSKMLGTCCCAHIFTLSLQTPDKCNTQSGNQDRIFPIGLMSSSPAGITEKIDIG